MQTINKTLRNSTLADRTYIVGGAVRDGIMGQPVEDMDYVVEATEEEFRSVFPAAEMVGIDFPVFLIEGDEVALTRTERSNGEGYGAFELTGVGVPIEDDLMRRDFTINAIAQNIVTGELVDPLGGVCDIKDGEIRTTHSESFGDDPVRILRAFRFVARYNFKLCFSTFSQATAFSNKLRYVTKERVVLELEKVWKQADKPSMFFDVAMNTKALSALLPELVKLHTVPAGPVLHHGNNTAYTHTMQAVNRAKRKNAPFHVFMALVMHDIGKAFTPSELLPAHHAHATRSEAFATEFLATHKFSKRVNEFVPKAAKLHMKVHNVSNMTAGKLVKFAMEIGKRDWNDMMTVFEVDHPLLTEQVQVLDVLRQMLFELDLSSVAEFPAAQRAEQAHQARVKFVRRNT